MTSGDDGLGNGVAIFSCWGTAVESVVAALASGLLTLMGVLISNSRSRALTEAKIDALTKQVEKHNSLIERTFNLERDMAVARNDIDTLKRAEADR